MRAGLDPWAGNGVEESPRSTYVFAAMSSCSNLHIHHVALVHTFVGSKVNLLAGVGVVNPIGRRNDSLLTYTTVGMHGIERRCCESGGMSWLVFPNVFVARHFILFEIDLLFVVVNQ